MVVPRVAARTLWRTTPAFQIMEGQGIPVNDLYTTALSQLKEIQIPFDVHFTFEGSEILAKQVADAILGVVRQAAPHRVERPATEWPRRPDVAVCGQRELRIIRMTSISGATGVVGQISNEATEGACNRSKGQRVLQQTESAATSNGWRRLL